MSLAMTREEREAFLSGLHVGILSVARDGSGPLSVPVWYAYEPGGDIRLTTGRNSLKAQLLENAGRATLTVQNEQPPYAYVMAEGPVSLNTPDFAQDIRAIAVRYLGEQGAAAYLGSGSDTSGSVLARLTPMGWRSEDYGKQRRE